ncbi:hypothetical protein DL768_011374 [Monosporascus sp. mg162]|nr:hypothetical protein DL768_011374 [Monosporascus sp. mg162]
MSLPRSPVRITSDMDAVESFQCVPYRVGFIKKQVPTALHYDESSIIARFPVTISRFTTEAHRDRSASLSQASRRRPSSSPSGPHGPPIRPRRGPSFVSDGDPILAGGSVYPADPAPLRGQQRGAHSQRERRGGAGPAANGFVMDEW